MEKNILEFAPPNMFEIVLAHLLLGEAEMFGAGFNPVLSSLFRLPTRHLIIVDILDDPTVKYNLILRAIANSSTVLKLICKDKYIGFHLLKRDKNKWRFNQL